MGMEMKTGTISTNRSVAAAAAFAVLLAALLSLCWASLAAADPYEPNDSSPAAYGPMGSGQIFAGSIDSTTDRDFFYFYDTAAGASSITVAVHSLGGNIKASSGLSASLFDYKGSPLTSLSFIRDGEVRSETLSLQPQKYFVEVAPSEGSGDSYELSVTGPAAAVGPFSQITAQCAAAEASFARSRGALSRAEGKLQRVIARLRRSRYASPKARASARAAARKARAVISRKRTGVRAAKEAREPWCSIAP